MGENKERRPVADRTANNDLGWSGTSVAPTPDVTRFTSHQLDRAILAAGPGWFASRVLNRTEPGDDGCLLWTGGTTGGYGQAELPRILGLMRTSGRAPLVRAHRAALVLSLGRPLGDGMQAGHDCHDQAYAAGLCVATAATPCTHRRCVNPEHLAEQDARTNLLSGGTPAAVCSARTHCPRGHELAGDNLMRSELSRGWRACLTCNRENNRGRSAVVSAACLGLGLTWREYRCIFGSARSTAENVLDQLARGVSPEVIVAAARTAVKARW